MRHRSWLGCLILAAAFAGAPDPACALGTAGDPLEEVNRAIFDFNRAVAKPFRGLGATVERTVPPAMIQGLRNFLDNLAEPGVALSYLAQGEPSEARVALERLIINSVEGPLGMRDMAAAQGLTQPPAGLADVLCRYGVPSGPYLMLPFYGGMTLRTLVAQVATISAGYLVFGEIYLGYRISSLGVQSLDPEGAFEHVQFLDNGRPDPYAAARAWQRLRARTLCE